jgi:hypothetical protein
MKKMLAVLVAGLIASPALASTLNLNVKSTVNNTNAVTVGPGAAVGFKVEGVLNDNLNEGLALVGFDLHLTGAGGSGQTPLPANAVVAPSGTVSCANPMRAFVKPEGITNPAGYGGTLIAGDLVQVGGGQNTIKNSVDNPACAPNCAPFPIGTPILGVAQPAVCGTAVVATGSFNAPATPGVYTLQVLNGFANIIKDGEVLANAFLATEAAGINVTGSLAITVGGCSGITASTPAKCSVDARRPHAPNQPATGQTASSMVLTMNNCGTASAGDFSVACTPAGAPCPTVSTVQNAANSVTVNFSTPIPAGKWTCVTHTASNTKSCIGSLPGDTSGNRTTAPADILDLIDHLNGIRVPPLAVDHCDMDRSGLCAPADIISLIDMLNGTNGFIVWNGKTLAVCPSP